MPALARNAWTSGRWPCRQSCHKSWSGACSPCSDSRMAILFQAKRSRAALPSAAQPAGGPGSAFAGPRVVGDLVANHHHEAPEELVRLFQEDGLALLFVPAVPGRGQPALLRCVGSLSAGIGTGSREGSAWSGRMQISAEDLPWPDRLLLLHVARR